MKLEYPANPVSCYKLITSEFIAYLRATISIFVERIIQSDLII